jgi:hypothetical protein
MPWAKDIMQGLAAGGTQIDDGASRGGPWQVDGCPAEVLMAIRPIRTPMKIVSPLFERTV